MVADVSYLEVPVMAPREASRQLGIPRDAGWKATRVTLIDERVTFLQRS